ncbi:hypothetical protein TREPR_2050 [Treponema primitia ZAS-2]|uniref:Uncharacterized protein n=1 Tax=Treponema primitia (strain ATCC BAA-887 / DSM 12427 / ZAS-2) TaxID=545694 RepID=F5YJT5_TREPZ|nr:hypothetical protein [Treponema primitia]AEF84090.1 hypothetical protein TREPR_2050 [Treponema primitia ZAS-2]
MNRIYRGQSALRITVKTFTDLEGCLSAAIKYRKPDGSTGSFTAGVGDVARGVIFHECLEEEIDKVGWWSLWAFITFADGRTAAGETVRVFVWQEGS